MGAARVRSRQQGARQDLFAPPALNRTCAIAYLGVSRHLLERIENESLWLRSPAFADGMPHLRPQRDLSKDEPYKCNMTPETKV
jgi:hypothetical protein